MRSTDDGTALQRGLSLTINLGLVLAAWFAYVVLAPVLWWQSPWLAVAAIIVIGGYLYTWLLYYRHELWHNYFPGLDNNKALDLVSHAIFSIPQVYRLCHGTHHKNVHTEQDMEFFCENFATDRNKRRRQFLLELFFGNIAWEWSTAFRLARAGKLSARDRVGARAATAVFLACAVLLARWIQPGAGLYVVLTFALTAWLGAVVSRQVQWIEHLGVLAPGCPLHERDMLTRSLPSHSLLARLINAYTHNDAREHVLHHTQPRRNSRAVDGLSLPPGCRTTTIGEHLRRLWTFYRSL